jgi:hypothetical protein
MAKGGVLSIRGILRTRPRTAPRTRFALHERVSNAGSIRKRRYANSGLSLVWYVTSSQVTLITTPWDQVRATMGEKSLGEVKLGAFIPATALSIWFILTPS